MSDFIDDLKQYHLKVIPQKRKKKKKKGLIKQLYETSLAHSKDFTMDLSKKILRIGSDPFVLCLLVSIFKTSFTRTKKI
jgi:hypothetical protein